MALLKEHFQIFAQREREYAFRFIAAPYTDDEANSALVYGHNKTPDSITGLDIERLLQKFGIRLDDFRSAYNEC